MSDFDADGDNVPNWADAYPNPGDGYWYGGHEYGTPKIDSDNDGVPDFLDPFPFPGSSYRYNGHEYALPWLDTDQDGVPDPADNWISDPYNNRDTDGDGIADFAEVTIYQTKYNDVDTDDDGLTDYDELFTYHTDPLLKKTNPNLPYSDFYAVDTTDTDNDGIPDLVEQWYSSQGYGMSATDPLDADGDQDGDGFTNLYAYEHGWSLVANVGSYDYDEDGISDVREDYWSSIYPGILSKSYAADAVADPDEDGVLNFEEIAKGTDPGNSQTHDSVADLTWINQEHGTTWGMPSIQGDADGDGMSDRWEHYYHFDVRSAANSIIDSDGDSLPNLQEYLTWRNPLVSDYAPGVSPVDPGVGVDPFAGTPGNTAFQPQLPTTTLPPGETADFSMKRFVPWGAPGQPAEQDVIFDKWSAQWREDDLHPSPTLSSWTVGQVTAHSENNACEPSIFYAPATGAKCACQHGTLDRFTGSWWVGSRVVYGPDGEPYQDGFGNPVMESYGGSSWYVTPNVSCGSSDNALLGEVQARIRVISDLPNHSEDMVRSVSVRVDFDDGRTDQIYTVDLTIPAGEKESTTLAIPAPPGATVTLSRKFNESVPSPTSSPLSLSDSAGSRYRKVGLNGVPMPDAKPQVQSENGEDNEETYIDAFLAQVRHSVSDVYVTEASSLMPLTVRRDVTPDSWNRRFGLRASERPTKPFGPCWSSNLCSYVRFDDLNKAEVVDELGARQQFFLKGGNATSGVGGVWLHDRQEHRDVKTRMNKLVIVTDPNVSNGPVSEFVDTNDFGTRAVRSYRKIELHKKFGTKCIYEMISPNELVQFHNSDRIKMTSPVSLHTYARLVRVQDRWGNVLEYQYPDDRTLIPSVIHDPARPGHEIRIEQLRGYVTSVQGPGGDRTDYLYDALPAPTIEEETDFSQPPRMLVGVRKGNSTVHYSYESVSEPAVDFDREWGPIGYAHFHRELASITDERGNAYQFAYRANDKTFYLDTTEGRKQQGGLPRVLTSVTSPIIGTVSIENTRLIDPTNRRDPSVPEPTTLAGKYGVAVHDATTSFTYGSGQNERTYLYKFSEPVSLTPSGHPFTLDGPEPITYAFTKMTLEAPDHGIEEFTFNPDASMALSAVTDRNGRVTTFDYGDTLTVTGISGQFFDDPTKETNALGQEKVMTYHASTRILKSITDVRGVKTTYAVDWRGRRTSETVAAATGNIPAGGKTETYGFSTGTFKGFMTSKTLSAGAGAAALHSPAMTTTYSLGSNASVAGWWRKMTETSTIQGQSTSTLTVSDFNGNKRSVTDGRGHTTLFDYDGQNRLTKVTNADGSVKKLAYDAHGNLTEETDELGVKTFHQYDALNRKVKTTRDMNGNGVSNGRYTTPVPLNASGEPAYNGDLVMEVAYNDLNLPVREIDGRGVVTAHEYDVLGRKTQTTVNAEGDEEAQALTKFEYKVTGINAGEEAGSSVFDTSGFKPVRVTDARNHATSMAYDDLYRPVQVTRPDNTVISTTYNAAGQVTSVSEPALAAPSGLEQAAGEKTGTQRLALSTTAPYVTQTEYDALGQAVKTTAADGKTVQNFYTPHGKAWKTIDEVGAETLTYFDTSGLPEQVVQDAPWTGMPHATTLMAYDKAGNAIAVTDPRSNVIRTIYDKRNQAVKVVTPAVVDATQFTFENPNPTPVSAVTATEYDAAGRVAKVTDTLGYATRTFYDAAGRVTRVFDAKDQASTMTYDAGGNVLVTKNALGQTVTNAYDGLGRLTTTTDAEGIVNTFGYDLAGNRTSVKDGAQAETVFEYDALNRLTRQAFANGDEWTYGYENFIDKTWQIDALGRTTNYADDKRHRLDTATQGVQVRDWTYDANGRLKKVTEPGETQAGTVEYTYDKLGRVSSETSYGKEHDYAYDVAGNRTQVEYDTYGTDKRKMVTAYDALNRPWRLTEDNATVATGDDRLTIYGYDKAGRAVMLVSPNGQLTRNTYDELGRLQTRRLYQSLEEEDDLGLLAGFTWIYDEIGNVTSQSEVWMESGTQPARTRVTVMTYDDSNRLETETVTDNVGAVVTTTYGYDDANNRTSKTVVGGAEPGIWSYTFNEVNQLERTDKRLVAEGPAVEGASYTYDDNGSRSTRIVDGSGSAESRTTNYTWDVWDHLVGVTQPVNATEKKKYSYTYDYRMRRTSVQQATDADVVELHTAITFSGGVSVAEYERLTNEEVTLATMPKVEYLRGKDMGGGVGGMLYSIRDGSTVKYSLSNGRGDIVAQSDSTATLTWTASYEAYGKRTKETGTNQDKQRANSKDEDPTGLLNEGHRYRDLESGTFISRDPAGFVDGPNVYAYVKQNPWSAFDPDGLRTKKQWEARREEYNNKSKELFKKGSGNGIRDLAQLAIYGGKVNEANKAISKIEKTAKFWKEFMAGSEMPGEARSKLARQTLVDNLDDESAADAGLFRAAAGMAENVSKAKQMAFAIAAGVAGKAVDAAIASKAVPAAGNNAPRVRLNIFGEGEARGFLDVSTNANYANGRPLTSGLASGSADDIFIRSAPMGGENTISEIIRLSKPGTRITVLEGAGSGQGAKLRDAFGDAAETTLQRSFDSQTITPGTSYDILKLLVK